VAAGTAAEAGEERRLQELRARAEAAAAEVARLQSQAADVVSAAQRRREEALRRQAAAERTLQRHLHDVEQVLPVTILCEELTAMTHGCEVIPALCAATFERDTTSTYTASAFSSYIKGSCPCSCKLI
jgi:hypothetical protein